MRERLRVRNRNEGGEGERTKQHFDLKPFENPVVHCHFPYHFSPAILALFLILWDGTWHLILGLLTYVAWVLLCLECCAFGSLFDWLLLHTWFSDHWLLPQRSLANHSKLSGMLVLPTHILKQNSSLSMPHYPSCFVF